MRPPSGAPAGQIPGSFFECAVSPDGDTIAALGRSSLVLIDRATGQRRTRPGRGRGSSAPAFRPDGHRVATARRDHSIAVCEVNDLAVVTVCSGHEAAINSIVFSDDGSRLLTASADGTVRIWNADSGPELTRLRGSDSEVWCALFSRDGEHVISGSRDGRIRIWHIADREVIAELTGHRDYVYSLALAPDGETIASGSGDGTVRLWGAEPPPALRRAARERREAVEELTPGVTRLFDEWTDLAAVVQRLRAKFAGRELELALQICLAESVRRRR